MPAATPSALRCCCGARRGTKFRARRFQSKSSDAGNAKLYGHAFDSAAHDAAIEAAKARLFALNPRSRILKKKGKRYAPGNPIGTRDTVRNSPDGTLAEPPDRPPDGIPGDAPVAIPSVSQETRKGQGQGQGHLYLSADGVGASEDACRRFSDVFPRPLGCKPSEPDGVRRELGRRLRQGVDLDEVVEGAKRYATQCLGRSIQHIGSPTKWLVDGRWNDGKPTPEATVPVVTRGTPQGEAWAEHLGPKAFWNEGRRSVPTEWPPGYEHRDAAE